ncbi:hypothetical protein F4679DRAFT_561108 [Xylaria curta]|nr:hypothetical protein F4679DRAFT_561108 [Xylaria curta]
MNNARLTTLTVSLNTTPSINISLSSPPDLHSKLSASFNTSSSSTSFQVTLEQTPSAVKTNPDEMAPVTPPPVFAAVQHAGTNYIFFVDAKNRISYYYGGSVQEQKDGDTYQKQDYIQVRVEGTRQTQYVNEGNPAMAAVAYTSSAGKELRVYYVDKDNKLNELCLSGANEWIKGDLTLKDLVMVSEKSCVAANVNEYNGSDYLKVFVNGEEARGNLICVYRQVDPAYPQWNRTVLTGEQYDPVF